jgi:hypothetical protein
VKNVYRDFLDEHRFKLLMRDLDEFLWRETYRDGEADSRASLVRNLRVLADSLEVSGQGFTRGEILVPEALRK